MPEKIKRVKLKTILPYLKSEIIVNSKFVASNATQITLLEEQLGEAFVESIRYAQGNRVGIIIEDEQRIIPIIYDFLSEEENAPFTSDKFKEYKDAFFESLDATKEGMQKYKGALNS